MSHADHATETIQDRIWLFCFGLPGSITVCTRLGGAILHREVANRRPRFVNPVPSHRSLVVGQDVGLIVGVWDRGTTEDRGIDSFKNICLLC